MTNILLESSARVLVLLHAIGAIVLVGAATHHAWISIGMLRGRHHDRLARIYAAISVVAYGLTFLLGALAYPAFRYHTRALYLDRYAPWASNLFDIKEHFASLGLPLVIGAFVLSRALDSRSERSFHVGYAVMVIGSTLIVWFNVVSGLLITLVKGV